MKTTPVICRSCNETRDLLDFSWRNKSKNLKHSICRFCVKERDALLYKEGKKKGATAEQSAAIRLRNRNWLREFLEQHPCVDCGVNDFRVLEFDHLPQFEKTANVAALASSSLERLQKEIAKCEVVCANCHKLRTYSRLDSCYKA